MTTPNQEKETNQLSLLNRINLLYGAIGMLLMAQIDGGHGAWKSFIAGWAVAVLNLELLKKLCSTMLLVFNQDGKLNPGFYVVLFGKFMFWGLVIALFMTAKWIQGVPFVLGTVTLLVSGVGLGMKELIYAR